MVYERNYDIFISASCQESKKSHVIHLENMLPNFFAAFLTDFLQVKK